MHIAQIAPLTEAVPPKLYGGTERVIYWLVEELVALGHEVTLFAPQPVKPSYFAFLGRIAPEKRVDRAIRIAEHCGIPLKIAAKIDLADRDYYEAEIRPMLASPNVEYVGEVSDNDKAGFLSGA